MDLMAQLQQERGLTVVMVSHDLNLAAMYGEQLLLLKEGKTVQVGAPRGRAHLRAAGASLRLPVSAGCKPPGPGAPDHLSAQEISGAAPLIHRSRDRSKYLRAAMGNGVHGGQW